MSTVWEEVFFWVTTAVLLLCGSSRRWLVWDGILTSSCALVSRGFWAPRVRGWDGLPTACHFPLFAAAFRMIVCDLRGLTPAQNRKRPSSLGFHAGSLVRECSTIQACTPSLCSLAVSASHATVVRINGWPWCGHLPTLLLREGSDLRPLSNTPQPFPATLAKPAMGFLVASYLTDFLRLCVQVPTSLSLLVHGRRGFQQFLPICSSMRLCELHCSMQSLHKSCPLREGMWNCCCSSTVFFAAPALLCLVRHCPYDGQWHRTH
jgi:hypothetical protein